MEMTPSLPTPTQLLFLIMLYHSDKEEARTANTPNQYEKTTPNGPVFPRETESAIKTIFSSNFKAHWLLRGIPPDNQLFVSQVKSSEQPVCLLLLSP